MVKIPKTGLSKIHSLSSNSTQKSSSNGKIPKLTWVEFSRYLQSWKNCQVIPLNTKESFSFQILLNFYCLITILDEMIIAHIHQELLFLVVFLNLRKFISNVSFVHKITHVSYSFSINFYVVLFQQWIFSKYLHVGSSDLLDQSCRCTGKFGVFVVQQINSFWATNYGVNNLVIIT